MTAVRQSNSCWPWLAGSLGMVLEDWAGTSAHTRRFKNGSRLLAAYCSRQDDDSSVHLWHTTPACAHDGPEIAFSSPKVILAGVNESSDIPQSAGVSAAGFPGSPAFATTHWSMVVMAGRSDATRARAALEQLCRTYWHPLYHYVRRRGYGPDDAADLTQAFFARLIEYHVVAEADPERGRFRSFLLACLKNFLSDQRDKASARKRGCGQVFAVDFQAEENRFSHEPVEHFTPEKAFERRWAMALLEQVYQRLEEEFRLQGKASQFAVLRMAMSAPRGSLPVAGLGRQLGMSEGAVRVAVHRLRKRYRQVLRETIAQTVAGPEQVEEELQYLLAVLAD